MNTLTIYPTQTLAQGLSEPTIHLEGQKVMFDKKVSLLPVDIKNEEPIKLKTINGKTT